MDKKPKISVIMSVYNEEINWIKVAIDSILNQSFSDLEFLIINDNPDNKEIDKFLSQLVDSRIKVIKNEVNMGLVKSLNKGIDASQGKYIARMDADDISKLDRFEKQYNYMEKNQDIALLGGKVNRMDENDNSLPSNDLVLIGSEKISKYIKYCNVVIHPTFFIRADVIKNKNIDKYREIPFVEDYDLVCRFISNGYKVENLNEILVCCRVRTKGLSRSNEFTQFKFQLYISEMFKCSKIDDINKSDIDRVVNDKRGLEEYDKIKKQKSFSTNKISRNINNIKALFISKYYRKRIINYAIIKLIVR